MTADELEAELGRDPHLRSIADERAADLARDFQRERAWLWALTEPDHYPDTATGTALDSWCLMLTGTKRQAGETDEALQARMRAVLIAQGAKP